ncbi:malonate transporter subunit MadL [Priestia abyssalis]|uniref:malonate transporter subunit MadL n=1 Tax=Priestia abyssalis TaxID=1221450 RepID=UPI000995D6EB|nr:malonate transporter subunit MadL [Priestia abyssalis]
MVIYGVSLLSICMLVGIFFGDLLGKLIGVDSNVGGVGIGMLMLVLLVDYLKKKNKLNATSQEGLAFWSSMYIPIVVAMAAQQNVVAAVKGGPVAILAGIGAVLIGWVLVPVLSNIGKEKANTYKSETVGGEQL